MSQLLKLILIGILVLTLLTMPAIFYKLSGYLLFVGFGWLSYDAFQKRDNIDIKIFAFLMILYNPFFTLPIPHFLLVIINIVVAIGLFLNILFAEENPYDEYIKKDDQ